MAVTVWAVSDVTNLTDADAGAGNDAIIQSSTLPKTAIFNLLPKMAIFSWLLFNQKNITVFGNISMIWNYSPTNHTSITSLLLLTAIFLTFDRLIVISTYELLWEWFFINRNVQFIAENGNLFQIFNQNFVPFSTRFLQNRSVFLIQEVFLHYW